MRLIQKSQIVYLLRVILGLLTLISVSTLAFILPDHYFLNGWVWWMLGVLILFFVVLFPTINLIYGKMDELQKKLHENAAVFAITFLISLSGIFGILQANGIIPLFNQFWMLGITIAVWAIALSFYDKHYK
jgi:hypothetical protein